MPPPADTRTWRCRSPPEASRAGTPHVFERIRPSGQVIEMRGQALPGGGYVTSYSDVTDYKRAEQALRDVNETLEQRVEQRTREAEAAQQSKTRFLAAVSHDVLQPLNAARLFTSALRESDSATEQSHLGERIDASLRAAEDLLGVVELRSDAVAVGEGGGHRREEHDVRRPARVDGAREGLGDAAAVRGDVGDERILRDQREEPACARERRGERVRVVERALRDLGAAVTARLHQRARHLALVADRSQTRRAVSERALGRHRADRPHERRPLARPVDALGGALGHVVVGTEQRRHLGRVRRAAGVLEQQRVEEIRARLRVEADLLRDPHADETRPHRVPGRLALGDVERVGEPADDLREPEGSRFHPGSVANPPRGSQPGRRGDRSYHGPCRRLLVVWVC